MNSKNQPDTPMQRFVLRRHSDPTGVSGTGLVAHGWVRRDRKAVVRWLGEFPTETLHAKGMASVRHIHTHGGSTTIVMCDDASTELNGARASDGWQS